MTDPKTMAVAYYEALGKKDMPAVEALLHPDIQFLAPFGKVAGKKAVAEAAKEFTNVFTTLKICAEFGEGTQAMIVYEIYIPAFDTHLQAASLLNFEEGLISKIELFYDTSCFKQKSEEVLSR